MKEEELQAIRARAEKATEGPWKWDADKFGDLTVYSPESRGFHNNGGEIARVDFGMNEDAEFIAAARQDVPRLLEHIDSKDEIIAQLWTVLGRANDLLDDAYDLLEDSVYHGHPTTDDIAEYLNVKGERGE